jgi:hypothetical protein
MYSPRDIGVFLPQSRIVARLQYNPLLDGGAGEVEALVEVYSQLFRYPNVISAGMYDCKT